MQNNTIRLAAPIQPDSTVDGPGIRTVIWTQGCTHHCPECHNPSTHDIHGGFSENIENIFLIIDKNNQDITLSGGDPILQSNACYQIAKYAKNKGLSVWLYTGYTIEELLNMSENNIDIQHLLNCVDVIVDGRFDPKLKTYNAVYRGSSNQRLIDVRKTLETNKVVCYNISQQNNHNEDENRFKQYF